MTSLLLILVSSNSSSSPVSPTLISHCLYMLHHVKLSCIQTLFLTDLLRLQTLSDLITLKLASHCPSCVYILTPVQSTRSTNLIVLSLMLYSFSVSHQLVSSLLVSHSFILQSFISLVILLLVYHFFQSPLSQSSIISLLYCITLLSLLQSCLSSYLPLQSLSVSSHSPQFLYPLVYSLLSYSSLYTLLLQFSFISTLSVYFLVSSLFTSYHCCLSICLLHCLFYLLCISVCLFSSLFNCISTLISICLYLYPSLFIIFSMSLYLLTLYTLSIDVILFSLLYSYDCILSISIDMSLCITLMTSSTAY